MRILCARCQRPVERIVETRDDFMQRTRFTAICHGEREHVDFTDDELGRVDSVDMVGVAFETPKRLT
jgi:hypothetical protein